MNLEQIRPPELINYDRDSLEREIIERIKRHPKWKDNYNGLLHHDALNMIIAIYTYLFGKNAENIDRKLRDVFLQSAYSDESKIYNLNQKNINLIQNNEAVTKLRCTLINKHKTDVFYIPNNLTVYGTGLNSSSIPFQIIKKDEEYDYLNNNIKINPGQNFTSFDIEAYSGITRSFSYNITPNQENFEIFVPYTNVIQNSIQVYYYLYGVPYLLYENKDDNYGRKISQSIFPEGTPKYILKYSINGNPRIIFGTDIFGGKFKTNHANGEIIVYGRYGGGSNDNIFTGSINETKEVQLNINESIEINFENITHGVGGSDRENLDDIIDFVLFRAGRGRQIVDTIDSKNVIQNKTVKHKIENASYEKEKATNNIPLFHNYHYIVPKKNINAFQLPIGNINESIDDYANLFVKELSEYLNVYGTHDDPIKKEFLTNFYQDNNNYDFDINLRHNPIISNTLVARAYNSNDRMIDEVKFVGNYPLNDLIHNEEKNDKAIIKSSHISEIEIRFDIDADPEYNINNNITFKLDNHDYLFDVSLASGTYTLFHLAASINSLIKNAVSNDLPFNHPLYNQIVNLNNKIVRYNEEEQIIEFHSLNHNKNSRIILIGEFNTPSYNFFNDLGISIDTYIPERSHLVFNGTNSYFEYTNNKLIVFTDKQEHNVDKYYNVEPVQNPNSDEGPLLNILLRDDKLIQNFKIQERSNIIIGLYNDDNLVEEVEISSYDSEVLELSSYDNGKFLEKSLLDDDAVTIFPNTSNLSIQLKNPIEDYIYISPFIETLGNLQVMYLYKLVFDESEEEFERELVKTFNHDNTWIQTVNNENGEEIYLHLNYTEQLIIGNDYVLEIYTRKDGETLQNGEILFQDVGVNITNGDLDVEDYPTDELFNSGINQTYSKQTNTIKLTLVDPTVNEEEIAYHAGYEYFNNIRLRFNKRSYEYIDVDYIADPYAPESEAKLMLDILNHKNKRIISLENVIKNINMIPVGLYIDLYIKNTYSFNKATERLKEVIIDNFQYDNNNYFHEIDEMITDDKLNTAIRNELINLGIVEARINHSRKKVFNKYLNENKKNYYFVLNDEIISLLKDKGDELNNLTNLNKEFEIDINVIPVEI